MKIFQIFWAVGLALFSTSLRAEDASPIAGKKRIVFLGDSITHAGRYVELFDAALISQKPDEIHEVIDVGLSSETVSGLSEEGHAGGAFPRPDLMERLDRVLAKTKPDLVVACYGMNCGIYKPLDETRFAAYRKGIETLRQKVHAAGAQIVHLTPPVYDDPTQTPFHYDDVLAAYGNWLLEKSKSDGWIVLDLHSAMAAALQEARKSNPQFTFSKDHVHPDGAGHQVFTKVLLPLWGLKDEPANPAVIPIVEKKQRLTKDAWISEIGHKRPGVKAGLPIAEALEKGKALDEQARQAAKVK